MRIARERKRGANGWQRVCPIQDIEVLLSRAPKPRLRLVAVRSNAKSNHVWQLGLEEILFGSFFPPYLIKKAMEKVLCTYDR